MQDSPETALNGNRKLIRPRLPVSSAPQRKGTHTNGNGTHLNGAHLNAKATHHINRKAPSHLNEGVTQPEPSHAEVFYFQKQVQAQTPMIVVLDDGERLEGIIEWFDKDSLKLRLTTLQRVLVYKTAIKFMHKVGEVTA